MVIARTGAGVLDELGVLCDGVDIAASCRRGPAIVLITKGGSTVAIDDVVEVLIMGTDALALSYPQQGIINADVVGDNKIIPQHSIGVVSVGADADAMFPVAKGEVVGYHGPVRSMPQINATTCIIVGDIINDMASSVRMIDPVDVLAELRIGASNVIDDVGNDIIVM